MSRHRVVANLDYDDELSEADADDYYDDGEDEIATAKGVVAVRKALADNENKVTQQQIQEALWESYNDVDKAVELLTRNYIDADLMNDATLEVLKGLGTSSNDVTTKQIQDSLWHYYYDVEKTVSYLQNSVLKQAAKAKTKEVSDGEWLSSLFQCKAQSSANGVGQECLAAKNTSPNSLYGQDVRMAVPGSLKCCLSKSGLSISPSLYFYDMPWLSVPKSRQAVFYPPVLPSVGLLGGGDGKPKMTKLQALAAARKKATAEKKDLEVVGETLKNVTIMDAQEEPSNGGQRNISKRYTSHGEHSHSPNPKRIALSRDPGNASSPSATAEKGPGGVPGTTSRPGTVQSRAPQESVNSGSKPVRQEEPVGAAAIVSPPSSFAQTLFGPPLKPPPVLQTFPLPYTQSPAFVADIFSKPSPDDIVLKAQSKAGKKAATAAPSKGASKANQKPKTVNAATAGVKGLEIVDEPRPKSKKLDVVKEYESLVKSKKSTSFVVVGHVDAGKSTLMGRLLLELRFVDKNVVEKYRRQAEKIGKQSFALAWVMDQRPEERDRGVTIDIATNHFETEHTRFTILDAPGHKDFIPNMIAGASQADFGILVIDANTGAFERGLKGQTREHVLLLRSLGVHRLIVAINKLDMVDWSKDRFDQIRDQVMGFLTTTGFIAKNITFIPISGVNGDNLTRRSENPNASWYKGETLLDALDHTDPVPRSLRRPFRMAISEHWKSSLGQVTVSGRIDTGTIQVGDELVIQPSGDNAYVKSLMVDTDLRDWAVAGESISMSLTSIDPTHLRVGDIVCLAEAPIGCSDTFTMKAMAFEHLMPMPVDLHRGRLHSEGQILELDAILDKATGDTLRKKPKVIQPGKVARIVVKLESKIPLEAGQRVVIRSSGETVAAGLVE